MACEICKDTGWYGDNGPGRRGNKEYIACECKAEGKEPIENTCKWERMDDESDCYETSCDQAFCLTDGTPKENGFAYCAFCGKKLIT